MVPEVNIQTRNHDIKGTIKTELIWQNFSSIHISSRKQNNSNLSARLGGEQRQYRGDRGAPGGEKWRKREQCSGYLDREN